MPSVPELEKLPNELYQVVESFKKFLREQKAFREQQFTPAAILEVSKNIEDFTNAFARVEADSMRNTQIVQQIKDDTTKLLRYSEMAYSIQRLQNSTAFQYFIELTDQFEAKMKAYAQQVKELKTCLDSIKRPYNIDELFQWLKKQHELLGEIAAKIYVIHERIE